MSVSSLLPLAVMLTGSFLFIRLRFFPITRAGENAALFISAVREKENRRALFLALAGTLGVGNIFGVAAGLMIGGVGSVFWLLVSSLFAMIIKYAETALSLHYLSGEGGGMHEVIRRVYGRLGAPLSKLYALLCLLLSFFMGAGIQSAAVYDVAESALGIEPITVAFPLLAIVAFGTLGGGSKIEKLTAFIIPLTTIIYILLSFSVIILNFDKLGTVICSIVSKAFAPGSAKGGLLAYFTSSAVKEGFSRGILSNEAGAGTSAMAHSRAAGRAPRVAGLFGMCEVFFDTVILCTLTALAVIASVDDISLFSTPMSLVSAAFTESLGEWSGAVLLFCILAFAYSTVICWYYYGSECSRFVFGTRLSRLFTPVFLSLVPLSIALSGDFLLLSTDAVLLLMALLTLATLLFNARTVGELTFGSPYQPRKVKNIPIDSVLQIDERSGL